MDEDFVVGELFEPVPDDYGIGMLESLLGGIIRYVAEGDAAALSEGSLISQGVGILNIVVLVVAVVVGTYSMFSLMADTASDGQMLGRSTDTKWTLLRAAAAAIGLIPIQGGFSTVQLLCVYLMVGGSGLGDTTWNEFSESTLTAESYVALPELSTSEEFRARGEFGEAAYTLTQGHLCRLHILRIAEMADQDVSVDLRSATFDAIDETRSGTNATQRRAHEMFFQTTNGARNATGLCGSIRHGISFATNLETGGFAAQEVSTLEGQLHALARDTVFNEAVQILVDVVEPRSADLALRIYSGWNLEGGEGLRDNEVIKAEIEAIATEAAATLYAGRVAAIDSAFGDEKVAELQESLQEEVARNGWVTAPIWQRGLSSI